MTSLAADPAAATRTTTTVNSEQKPDVEAGVHRDGIWSAMTANATHAPRGPTTHGTTQLPGQPPRSAGLVEAEVRCTARTLAAERALCRLQHENDQLKRREVAMLQEQRGLRALATRLRGELQAMGNTVVEQTVTMKAFANEMERRDPYHLVKAKRACEQDRDELSRLRAELARVQADKAELERQHSADVARPGRRQEARYNTSGGCTASSPERIDRDEDEDEALLYSYSAELRCLLRAYDALYMRLLQQGGDGDAGHVADAARTLAPQCQAVHQDDENDGAEGAGSTLYSIQLRVLSCHRLQLRKGDKQDDGEVYVTLRGPLEGTSARTALCKVSRSGEARFVSRHASAGACKADCSFRAVPDTQGQVRLEVWRVQPADTLLYKASMPVGALLTAAATRDDDNSAMPHAARQPLLHTLPLTLVSVDTEDVTPSTTMPSGSSICVEVRVSSVDATLLSLIRAATHGRGRPACTRRDDTMDGSVVAPLPLSTRSEPYAMVLEVLRVTPAASHNLYPPRQAMSANSSGTPRKPSPPRGWLVVVYDEDGGRGGAAHEVFRTHVADKNDGNNNDSSNGGGEGMASAAQALYSCRSPTGQLRFRVYDGTNAHYSRSLDGATDGDKYNSVARLATMTGSQSATVERPWRSLGTHAFASSTADELRGEAVLAKDELSRWGAETPAAVCARVLPLCDVRPGRAAHYGEGGSGRIVWGTLTVRCWWAAAPPPPLQLSTMRAGMGAGGDGRDTLRQHTSPLRLRRRLPHSDDTALSAHNVLSSRASDGVTQAAAHKASVSADGARHDDDSTPRPDSNAVPASVAERAVGTTTTATAAADHVGSARSVRPTGGQPVVAPAGPVATATAAAVAESHEAKATGKTATDATSVAPSPASSSSQHSPNASAATHVAATPPAGGGETPARTTEAVLPSPRAIREVASMADATAAPPAADVPSPRRITVYVKEGRHLMENGEELLDVLGTCDPRVRVWRGEELLLTVPEVHAALQPRWPRNVASCTIDLESSHTLRFEVQDVQVSGIDPMGTASVRGGEVLQRLGEHELAVRLAGKQYGTLVVDFTEAT